MILNCHTHASLSSVTNDLWSKTSQGHGIGLGFFHAGGKRLVGDVFESVHVWKEKRYCVAILRLFHPVAKLQRRQVSEIIQEKPEIWMS